MENENDNSDTVFSEKPRDGNGDGYYEFPIYGDVLIKHAYLTGKKEAMRRMIDGECFYYNGHRFYLDILDNFVEHYDRCTSDISDENWLIVRQWKRESAWYEIINHAFRYAYCWVWNNEPNKEHPASIKYHADRALPFEDLRGVSWMHAQPIEAQDLAEIEDWDELGKAGIPALSFVYNDEDIDENGCIPNLDSSVALAFYSEGVDRPFTDQHGNKFQHAEFLYEGCLLDFTR